MKRMKTLSSIVLIAAFFALSCGTKPQIDFIEKNADNSIDVMIDGKLFTSFCWPDNVFKPILYPVLTSAGTEITRGFPINPRIGERADHAHHTGIWLTYGNVNGNDFWGNGHEGLGIESDNGGVIRHIRVDELTGGSSKGHFITYESWTDTTGEELLAERTAYHFIAEGSTRIIDRITTLTAGGLEVSLPDTKEGMFGIRVARQLELPSEDDITLYGEDDQPTLVEALSNEGISGNYRSSEGDTGSDVWGTRAKWMDLYGNIGDEKISLVICDHPKNPSYPTYWHARGYGLFSANPFGWDDFTNGKEQLNHTIPAGQSVTFRYRVIISSGIHLDDTEINIYADNFARKY
ncbi:MAG: PmoA family protein [Bacteroidota bacterium]